MHIESYERLGGRVTQCRSSFVLIRDDFGNPISVACQLDTNGPVVLSTVEQPDFQQILHNLGIDQLVVCDSVTGPAKPPTAKRLVV